jgi:hypothetical protein
LRVTLSLIRQTVVVVVVVAAGLSGGSILRESAPVERLNQEKDQLVQKVADLSRQVSELRQEQGMPALILSRHSFSICFIYAENNCSNDCALSRP